MTLQEFDDMFDVYYNNITSNQAPGLNTYEKSVFLTRAEKEIVKNHFTANSKGNDIGQGYDDSAKRQADFSILMKTFTGTSGGGGIVSDMSYRIDPRSYLFTFPEDVFIVINESIVYDTDTNILQVKPLRYDEYTNLMSKPFKRPNKYQAWRLINTGSNGTDEGYSTTKVAELILGPDYSDQTKISYRIRYVRTPKPIILGNLDGLTIDGFTYSDIESIGCELDPILHDDILQRAVELAKISWTATGQDNLQPMMAAGQRSE